MTWWAFNITSLLLTLRHTVSFHFLFKLYMAERGYLAYLFFFFWMIIVALFIIAPNWKQPKCSWAIQWINKLRSIRTMEYHLAKEQTIDICNNMVEFFRCIMVSKRNQTQKPYTGKFHYDIQKRKTYRNGKQVNDCWRLQ